MSAKRNRERNRAFFKQLPCRVYCKLHIQLGLRILMCHFAGPRYVTQRKPRRLFGIQPQRVMDIASIHTIES